MKYMQKIFLKGLCVKLSNLGKEVPGVFGYKYFGAARDLPGVRELFEAETPDQPKKTRAELMKDIDAAYYGYRDDEDNLLVPLEIEAEKTAIENAIKEWKERGEEVTQCKIFLQFWQKKPSS